VKSFEFKEDKLTLTFSEKYPVRMSFRRPPSDVDRMTSLRVDNLPYSAVMEDLQPLFERFGDVGDIYLPKERDSGRSRGFAFVRFFDKHDAEVRIVILEEGKE